jgi:hypothetical protein
MIPAVFDLFVGIMFLIAIICGTLFGITRMILMFLAFCFSMIAAWLLMAGGIDVVHLVFQGRIPAAGALASVPLVLIALAIAFGPRARTVAGRILGALFATALTVAMVSAWAVELTAILPQDELQRIREKTLTGETFLTVGNALVSRLPESARILKGSERPATSMRTKVIPC